MQSERTVIDVRLIDADALIDDLKHDVAADQDSLDYEELTDSNREMIQFDKDCKQNAIDLLQNAPTIEPEQQWIPCEERLPEVGTYVLVSKKPLGFRSNLPNVCTAHRSRDPRSGKEEWIDMLFGKLDDDDVLAWMPLPKLYSDNM